ncbi:D-aminoacyl-tRNA deacylase [Dellaglioa sp. BT-FLS60]
MKVIVQRVKSASVSIDNQTFNRINAGYLLLVGFKTGDTSDEIDYMVKKISNSRLFEDDEGKMNLSIQEVKGEILSISQFTLYASTKKGNRPSFTMAEEPDSAKKHYEEFNQKLAAIVAVVKPGQFGADMAIELINDGPVTIIYDSEQK